MASANKPERRILVLALLVSAVFTVGIGIALGALVSPALYAICLVAIIDLWLARRYATGRGPGEPAPGPGDPSYNPYARED